MAKSNKKSATVRGRNGVKRAKGSGKTKRKKKIIPIYINWALVTPRSSELPWSTKLGIAGHMSMESWKKKNRKETTQILTDLIVDNLETTIRDLKECRIILEEH